MSAAAWTRHSTPARRVGQIFNPRAARARCLVLRARESSSRSKPVPSVRPHTAAMSWWVALAPKFMVGGGMAVGMAGRRAFTPFLIMGTAVTSAAWFGAFEACFSFSKLLMPVPEKPDSSAQTTGVATVPCVIGLFGFAGWRTCPLLEAPPKELSNIGGWIKYGGSMPLRHVGTFGLASAAVAAVTCRVVQYRGGA